MTMLSFELANINCRHGCRMKWMPERKREKKKLARLPILRPLMSQTCIRTSAIAFKIGCHTNFFCIFFFKIGG